MDTYMYREGITSVQENLSACSRKACLLCTVSHTDTPVHTLIWNNITRASAYYRNVGVTNTLVRLSFWDGIMKEDTAVLSNSVEYGKVGCGAMSEERAFEKSYSLHIKVSPLLSLQTPSLVS